MMEQKKARERVGNEYYGTTARHYDHAYNADKDLNDIPFYVNIAKQIDGRVLEVACGTGRVLLPTARAGVTIDGLDFSPDLLDILRSKLQLEALEVQHRVNLQQGDMRSFSFGKTYDLITIPFRPLQHLYTIEDQLAAFECFNRHLEIGGKLAFNVYYPRFENYKADGIEQPDLEWKDPDDTAITIKRFYVRHNHDRLKQITEGELIFRSYRGEEEVKVERSALNMSYYTYPQVLLLLKTAGFKVVEEYGSFDKEPISVCKEMIFVAEKI